MANAIFRTIFDTVNCTFDLAVFRAHLRTNVCSHYNAKLGADICPNRRFQPIKTGWLDVGFCVEDYVAILSARVDMAKDSRAAEKRLERERDRVQHEQDVEKERGDGVSKCELKCDESGFGDLLAVLVCSPGTKLILIIGSTLEFIIQS